MAGKCRLTIGRIDAIQNFYGRAIPDNPMDPEAMSKYSWTILDRYSSTVKDRKHDNCPPGGKSWCRYQRDIATKQSLHKPVKWSLRDAILAVVNTVFQLLVMSF